MDSNDNNNNRQKENSRNVTSDRQVQYRNSPQGRPSQNPQRKRPSQSSLRQRKPEKDTKSMQITYIAIVTVMIIVFMLFFFFMFKTMFPDNGNDSTTVNNNIEQNEVIEEINNEAIANYKTMTGFVKEIRKNSLILFDINSRGTIEIFVDNKTTITDAYNKKIIFLEIEVGDGFTVEYHKDNFLAKTIQSAKDYYEHKNITGVTVDPNDTILYVHGREYKYDINTIFLYNGEDASIETLNEKDTLDMKVIGDTCYYISVKKPHGGLILTSRDHIKDGTIEVDTDEILYIDDVDTITLSEGTHRVVVKGTNIEPYVYDFTVTGTDFVTLDLSVVEERKSTVSFTANVEEFTLTFNEEVTENFKSGDTIDVPYGTYEVTIEQENYEPYTATVQANSPTVKVVADLTQIELSSKISISTTPEGAQIYVDNNFIGTSPVEQSVEYGSHNISISMEGYKLISFVIDAVDPLHKYNVVLQKEEE
ncbi:MAG: PEGA domain-containing protein [Lachnospirales bacterium]